MPLAPLRPCSSSGCRELVRGKGKCPKHAKQQAQAREAQRTPRMDPGFYASKPWRRLRAIVLKEEPICLALVDGRACGAETTTADHIIDRRIRPDLALERSNVRGRCKTCHDRRTITDHLNRRKP